MKASKLSRAGLQAYVDGIVGQYGIPALSLAIWHNNTLHRAASGVLNTETGVEATVDSVFQIGSISKVFTASLIMLLVDAGKVELDRPVKYYLKNFHVRDQQATDQITVRQLLTHTSGLVSDISFDQDDANDEGSGITRYVDRCFLLPQVHHQLGKRFSYSNAAYVIAGRVAEVVSGVSWRQAIGDCIFKPLSMGQSLACPMEVLRFRAAIGHLVSGPAANRKTAVVSSCYLPMGMAPTASVLTMSASDLLRFGRAHLNKGKTESGNQWMSERSVRIMQEVQINLPAPTALWESSWGLGWARTDCQGVQAFGHGGGTIGQQAMLAVIPESDSAFSFQVNGMVLGGGPAVQQVLSDMLYEMAGVRFDKSVRVDGPRDLTRFIGRFGGTGFIFEIKERDGQLCSRMEVEGAAAFPAQSLSLEPVGENRFAAYTQDREQMDDFTFLEPDQQGVPQYLFSAHRLHGRM